MNTDKIAIGLLLTVHAIAACVDFYLIVRDFIRKHRRGLTPLALDGATCPACGQVSMSSSTCTNCGVLDTPRQ